MSLHRNGVLAALDKVEAVLRTTKPPGQPPLTRDRAAVLPGEREDLQAVVPDVADVQLVPNHSQLLCTIEQPQPEAVAKLSRLRIQGDDLICCSVIGTIDHPYHAKEKAAALRNGQTIALEPVLRLDCAVVRGAS